MVTEITLVPMEDWPPAMMIPPGTALLLQTDTALVDDDGQPFYAMLACPECGIVGFISRKQAAGLVPVTCGSDLCPIQFVLEGDRIIQRKPS